MIDHRLYLSASTDAVDACWVTKEHAIRSFAKGAKVPLSDIGAIGDSANDLPFMTIPELGLVGAPLNAQPEVRSAISRLKSCIQISSSFLDAFVEFYRVAQKRQIRYVFADKDGVLTWTHISPESLSAVTEVFRSAGLPGCPFVFILTGSSYEQNMEFLELAKLKTALASNPYIAADPFIVLAENGMLRINVLTGEMREGSEMIDRLRLAWLKGPFEQELIALVEKEVLPRFGLKWSERADNQVECVWIPRKRTMVTLNIPREFRDGRDYRLSAKSVQLGRAIVSCMVRVAEANGVEYAIL